MPARDSILLLANRYAEHTGCSLSALGRKAMGDDRFFHRLALADRSCTTRTVDKLLDWFGQHWPDPAAWPVEVQRPSVAKAA